jgi:hypothetical protein
MTAGALFPKGSGRVDSRLRLTIKISGEMEVSTYRKLMEMFRISAETDSNLYVTKSSYLKPNTASVSEEDFAC